MPDNGLNINNSELTNEDIVVTYTPVSGVVSYSYKIYNGDKVIETKEVLDGSNTTITLNNTGVYKIEITTFDGNEYNTITSGSYYINKDYNKKEEKAIEIEEDNVETTGKGNNNQLLFSQIFVISILIIVVVALLKYNKTLKKEKRLARYTVKPLKNNSKALFETFVTFGNSIIDKLTKLVSKSEILKKQSNKYDKYVVAFDEKSSLRFIGKKVFVGIVFTLIGVIVATLRLQTLNIYEIVILLVVGYYGLDLVYKYRYYNYCKKIENDLLQAIIVMNNAFKSGRSINQAIELVGNELNGPISVEFKKIHYELSLGLDIEVAFKRFADRINIEEATYLTSSLSILNKTGGNIVKVFSSIEKTLFNRKKLRIELKELTGSSKIIMWVLSIVPVVFIIFIMLFNPEYFEPLYQNGLGFIIIGAIMVLYVVYLVVVRKIMKIRM